MKRLVFWQLFVAALLLTSNSHAQSIKDLFNKENIEKAVNAVTGKSTADMTGTCRIPAPPLNSNRTTCCRKPAVPLPPQPQKRNWTNSLPK